MAESKLFGGKEYKLRLKQADAFALALALVSLKEELESKRWRSWKAVSDRIRAETKYGKQYPPTALASACHQAGVTVTTERGIQSGKRRLIAARMAALDQQVATLTAEVAELKNILRTTGDAVQDRRLSLIEEYLTSKNGFQPASPAAEPAAEAGRAFAKPR